MPHRIAPTVRLAGLPALAMLVLAGFLYWATTSLVSREFDAQSALRIERRATLLAERFGLAVKARAREVEQLARAAPVVQAEDWARIRHELEWLKARVPAFVWIGFVSPDGVVRAATGQWLEGTSISKRPVFVEGQRALSVSDFHPAVALAPYLGGTSASVADIGVPVFGPDGELRGVIAAHTGADWFINLGERTVTDEETEKLGLDWFMVRSDGTTLNGTLPFAVPSGAGGEAFELRDAAGHRYAGLLRQVRTVEDGDDPLGWRALVVSRVDIANAPLDQFNRTFAVFAVLSTLVCIAGGLLLARFAARPLDNFFSVVRKRFEAVGGPHAMPYNQFLGVLGEELATALPDGEGPEGDILRRLASDAQQLRRAFDHLPVAVAISTTDFRVQYVNQTYTRMLGWTTDMVAGLRTAEFLFTPDEREDFQSQLRMLDNPPGELAARFEAVCADGSRRSVHWEMSPVLDRAGAFIGAIVMIQDITGEMAAQRRALALSDRLRVFADSAIDYALVMLDSEGRVETWSRGATALMSLNESHGIGLPLSDLLHDGLQGAYGLLQTALTSGHADVAAGFTRPGYDSFFAEGKLYRLSAAQSSPSFALIVRDTTIQRAAQRQLAESQSRLAAVIASASDAIVVSDVSGVITLFNPAAERIFGWSAESMIGLPLDRLLPQDARGGHAAGLRSFAASGVSRRKMGAGKVFGLNASGERIELEASISQAEVAGETVLMAILRDVTERSRADQALVKYQLQLAGLTRQLLAQEKETTRLLAQSLHDDLGQTLGAMRLIFDAGMLGQPKEDASDWLQRLNELIAASNRQVRQVLTDLRPPLLDELGLVAALDNEVRQRRSLHPDVEVRFDSDDAASIRWPPDVEYAAFMVTREAVNNALQHGQPDNITVRLRGDANSLVLAVSDDGSGMPAEELKSTTVKVGHLGLVGMRERSFAIGAALEISSARDRGTTVTLSWEDENESPLLG